ncbi:MAG: hypothetical protein IRY95_07100 [Clostridia bacterium]|nr:hypothetical protein [Clostridia bacterium]
MRHDDRRRGREWALKVVQILVLLAVLAIALPQLLGFLAGYLFYAPAPERADLLLTLAGSVLRWT